MMELMEINLQKIISKSEQVLSEAHMKCLMKQLLEGLNAMHLVGICHRDIKPANLLVNQDCQLRITDFGLARRINEASPTNDTDCSLAMTEYVVTRWYRAPELLIAPSVPYNEAIDMWSAGCILAEMANRKPIFQGRGYVDQVHQIFSVLGLRDARVLGFPVSASNVTFLNSKCRYPKKSFSRLFPALSADAVHLLESLLEANPKVRSTAKHALSLPFFADAEVLFDYSDCYVKAPPPEYFDFERGTLDCVTLANMIRNDVANFNRTTAKGLDLSPAACDGNESDHTRRTSIESTNTSLEESYADIEQGLDSDSRTYSISVFPDGKITAEQTFSASEKSSAVDPASANPFSNKNCALNRFDRMMSTAKDIVTVNSKTAPVNGPVSVSVSVSVSAAGAVNTHPPSEERTEQDGPTSSSTKFGKLKGFPITKLCEKLIGDGRLRRHASLPCNQLAVSVQKGKSLHLPPIAHSNTSGHNNPYPSCSSASSSTEQVAAYFNSQKDREKRFSIDEDGHENVRKGDSSEVPQVRVVSAIMGAQLNTIEERMALRPSLSCKFP